MKNRIQTVILLIAMVIICSNVSCSYLGGGSFGAGSYCRVERFKFNTTSDELIERIMLLKEKHPELNVFSTNQEGEIYNLDSPDREYFYCFYFKIPVKGKNAFVHTVVRKGTNYPAVLTLNGFSYSPTFGDWADMYDLKEQGRDEEKKSLEVAFKKYVLDEIGYEPQ